MFGKILVGDKELELVCTAATRVHYKQIFHEDLFVLLVDKAGKTPGSEWLDMSDKLAYVMNMQANKADMTKCSFDTFVEWLEQFDSKDLLLVSEKIIAIYNGDQASLSIPKKKAE